MNINIHVTVKQVPKQITFKQVLKQITEVCFNWIYVQHSMTASNWSKVLAITEENNWNIHVTVKQDLKQVTEAKF